jgi:hypothetical protein
MTLDGDAFSPRGDLGASLGASSPRGDKLADILETPRGRREWQEYKASTERVHLRDRVAQLEERCRAAEVEREERERCASISAQENASLKEHVSHQLSLSI